jgi:hypothetical protein
MEKTIKEIVQVERASHEFYCDECNKYLGTSEEYEDGWYQELGKFEQKIYIDKWYRFKKCLCDNCQKSFIENLKVVLKNIGFEKD